MCRKAQQKVGYSYINPGNANFILALVSLLAASAPLYSVQSFMEHPEADPSTYPWGKIPVITGYKQQKLLLEEKLSKLSSAEIPRGIVSVRTIDDSPSHQAEVVICDLARSDGPGSLSDLKRLAIMTTRAQGMTILVGQEVMFAVKNSAISELYNYLKSRDGIVKVSGWKGDHAGRHCKEAQPFNQATFANVPEVDDIFRPIFSTGKVEKGQSVKRVKHQRVQAKKESAANYHAKEARKLTQSFYSYDKPADANKSQDGSILQIPLASICLGVMK
ncbi:hypothetical protein Trihar35433_4551 [Trichoderma harzianum]|nr:hypothetical protein Trihar35433_4551 [Trichoderma harzianum]